MYEILLKSTQTIRYTAPPVPLPKTIELVTGWNRIPCPYQTATAIASAMPKWDAGSSYSMNDEVKNKVAGSSWYMGSNSADSWFEE